MKYCVSLLLSLLLAAPALAQTDQTPPADTASDASKAAENFSLDLGTDDNVTTADTPDAAPNTPAPVVDTPAPAPAAPAGRFTVDTPIEMLLASARARAVLDRNLPGLSTDKNLAQIRNLSLRALQSHSGGRLTDALLEKTGKDLAAIPPRSEPPGR